MPNDTYTTLNPGVGGDHMDESAITYGDAPTTRKRERIVISDDSNAAGLAAITNSQPAGTEYGLVVREAQLGQATMAASRPVVIASNQSNLPVAGAKTNNNAAPGATNVGALVGIANASAPTWTEGNEVLLSTDLSGSLRTIDKSVVAQASTTSGQSGQLIQGAVTTAAPSYTTAQTNPLSLTTAGALRVDNSAVTQPVSGTITANAGTGTFASSNSETITDNNAFTDGTSKVFAAGFILDEVAGTALTENDAAAARINANRSQICVIEDDTTRGRRTTVTAANALKVDGSAVTQPVSGTVTANAGTGTFTVAGAKTNNNAAPGATNVGVLPVLANASAPTWTEGNQVALSSDLTGALRVSLSGTSNQVVGNIASGDTDSGNPVKIGGVARTANPTAVTDGQRSNAMTDKMGRLVTVNSHVRNLVGVASITLTTTTETTLIAAGGSGVFNDIANLVISNSDSNAVNVLIRDTTGGTVLATFSLSRAGSTSGATSAVVIPFNTPWPQTTANTNWTAQLSVATTNVNIFVQYVKNI